MMNNSFMYGLTNPAFTEDIFQAGLNTMYPCNMDYLSGLTQYGITGNLGQPLHDYYMPSKQKKEYNFLKSLLVGGAAVGLSYFGLKKGTNIVKTTLGKAKNFIKNLFKRKKTSP